MPDAIDREAIVDRAAAFIRAHGDELDRIRLDRMIGKGAVLADAQKQRFFAGQRSDGGWPPFWAPDYSGLDATCYRLAQGEGLEIPLRRPPFRRAIDFLRSCQRPDGSWEEDEAMRDPAPMWAIPGELASRLYLTANCGWWLANATLSGSVTTDEAAIRAGAYLEHHLAQDGALPSFLQTHWLAVGLWILLGCDDLAYRTLDYLASRLDATTPANLLVWALTTLGWRGIPVDHPFGEKATTLLIAQQCADGGWASDENTASDAYVTCEALRGLLLWAAL